MAWSRHAPRTRDVDWRPYVKRQAEARKNYKNQPACLVYVLVHNRHRDSYTGVREPGDKQLYGPVGAVHDTLRAEYGYRWTGRPQKVADVMGFPVYVLHVMRPLSKDQMADIGWDRVDRHISGLLSHDPDEEWPLTEACMMADLEAALTNLFAL